MRALPSGMPLTTLVNREPRAFTFPELVALSSHDRARRAIARGEIVRVLPNSYVAAAHAESFAGRADAALNWAGPQAVLAGTSALHRHGIVPPPQNLALTVPRSTRLRPPPWLRLTRISYPVATSTVQGMTTATVGFALAQAFGHLPTERRSETAYRALRSGRDGLASLEHALRVMPQVKDRARLTRIASAVAQGAESWLEEQGFFSVFSTKEFRRLTRQHTIVCAGRRYRLDLYDPQTRTAIELDGAAFHGSPDQRQADISRDAALASMGVQTLRFSYSDIVGQPERCREVVRQVLAARAQ